MDEAGASPWDGRSFQESSHPYCEACGDSISRTRFCSPSPQGRSLFGGQKGTSLQDLSWRREGRRFPTLFQWWWPLSHGSSLWEGQKGLKLVVDSFTTLCCHRKPGKSRARIQAAAHMTQGKEAGAWPPPCSELTHRGSSAGARRNPHTQLQTFSLPEVTFGSRIYVRRAFHPRDSGTLWPQGIMQGDTRVLLCPHMPGVCIDHATPPRCSATSLSLCPTGFFRWKPSCSAYMYQGSDLSIWQVWSLVNIPHQVGNFHYSQIIAPTWDHSSGLMWALRSVG